METRSIDVTDLTAWAVALLFAGALTCGPSRLGSVSENSFDEVCHMVRGKSAAQVEILLGPPDTRQMVFGSDERWIWWSYTYLDGPAHPPELRGKIVHFEMVFRNPAEGAEAGDYSRWFADEALSPAYRLPGDDQHLK